MGRDFLEEIFKYKQEDFSIETLNHTYLCIALSLLAIIIGYIFFSRNKRKKEETIKNNKKDNSITKTKVSKAVFYITWAFAMISMIITARYVSTNSYANYYTDYSDYLSNNIYLYTISKIGTMMQVSFCIYCASMPSKKDFNLPRNLYVIYIIISLLSGQRSIFMLGLLFLLIYSLIRNGRERGVWMSRKIYMASIIIIPLIIVGLSIISNIRMGDNVSESTSSPFVNFIYDQGVSSNTIKRAYEYGDRIPKQIYSLEFLHSGIPARLLGIPIYHGNTVDHALHGGSMTHSLAYVVLGDSYLNGRGTGSSYITELYQDFGYVGIILGSLLYSFLLAKIDKTKEKNGTLGTSIKYCLILQLLWSPRASFTGFITNLIAPLTITTFIIIFGLSFIINEHNKIGNNINDQR